MTLIEKARERGSTATTRAGAWRYLLRHLPGPPSGWSATMTIANPYHNRMCNISRDRSYRDYHTARMNARYTRLGEECMARFGLAPIDEKAERSRVARLARRRELAKARESEAERELLAAGYALTRDGTHRVLTGIDDGHPFEVRVPLRCQTICEALDWLRPDGVMEDTIRQGEWFFVPSAPEEEWEDKTEAGSWRRVVHHTTTTFDRNWRHLPEECIVVVARGETCFIGRKAVRSHSWTGRPHVYVRGDVTHPEHGTIELGDRWHEVIPNRAHGPFEVGSLGIGGLD
jgi:hypothetical protein